MSTSHAREPRIRACAYAHKRGKETCVQTRKIIPSLVRVNASTFSVRVSSQACVQSIRGEGINLCRSKLHTLLGISIGHLPGDAYSFPRRCRCFKLSPTRECRPARLCALFAGFPVRNRLLGHFNFFEVLPGSALNRRVCEIISCAVAVNAFCDTGCLSLRLTCSCDDECMNCDGKNVPQGCQCMPVVFGIIIISRLDRDRKTGQLFWRKSLGKENLTSAKQSIESSGI